MVTLVDIITDLRRRPKSVEQEIILQDFLELSSVEQMEILFLGLCQACASADWAVAHINELKGNQDG